MEARLLNVSWAVWVSSLLNSCQTIGLALASLVMSHMVPSPNPHAKNDSWLPPNYGTLEDQTSVPVHPTVPLSPINIGYQEWGQNKPGNACLGQPSEICV